MTEEIRDFYYSDTAFNTFTLGDVYADAPKLVCECFIDGKWIPYTESISVGRKPLSAWGDLKYLGHTTETRYTRVFKWLEERKYMTLRRQ